MVLFFFSSLISISFAAEKPQLPAHSSISCRSIVEGTSTNIEKPKLPPIEQSRAQLNRYFAAMGVWDYERESTRSYGGILHPSAKEVKWENYRTSTAQSRMDLALRLFEYWRNMNTEFSLERHMVDIMDLFITIMANNFAKFEDSGQAVLLRERLKALAEADGKPIISQMETSATRTDRTLLVENAGAIREKLQISFPNAVRYLTSEAGLTPKMNMSRADLIAYLGDFAFLADEIIPQLPIGR